MSEIVPVIRDGMEHRITQLAESFARRIRSFVVRSAILGEEARPRHGTRSFCSTLSQRRCTRRTGFIGCSAALSVRIGVFVTKSRNHDYTGVFRLSTLARKLLQPRSGVESNVAIHILLQLRHLGNRLRLHVRRQHVAQVAQDSARNETNVGHRVLRLTRHPHAHIHLRHQRSQ